MKPEDPFPSVSYGHYAVVSYCSVSVAGGSSKQASHIPDAVCTVLKLLMIGGETAQNM